MLTPEREKLIRETQDKYECVDCDGYRFIDELLAEIDNLRLELKISCQTVLNISAIVQKGSDRLDIAVEALEFYADRNKINRVCNGTGDDYDEDELGFFAGKKARKALKEIRGENADA